MVVVNNAEDKLEGVIRKIQGLLKVAEGNANEEESQTAFVMAQKLMMKYNIEKSQVLTENDKDLEVICSNASAWKKVKWYEKQASIIVGDNFRVKPLITRNSSKAGKTAIQFMGLKEDVKIATEMYILIVDAIEYYANIYVELKYAENDQYRSRSYTAELKNSYISGYLVGLEEKYSVQKEELIQEYGLVVLMPEVVERAIAEKNLKEKSFRIPSASEEEAYNKGYTQGKNTEYSKDMIEE